MAVSVKLGTIRKEVRKKEEEKGGREERNDCFVTGLS
jgi:hypothetical protein